MKKKCEKLQRLIVLTEEEKTSWKNKKNIEVIPNPLPFSLEESSSLENKKAIAVGRLAFEKGFDSLIRTWEIVNEKYPDWELSIYGNGPLKDELIQLIKDKGLKLSVKIYDPVANIQDKYLGHSMLIFSSFQFIK